MRKTTIYLPDDLRAAVQEEARRRGVSVAELIRAAVEKELARPEPRPGLFAVEPFAERADDLFGGFGER